jgi:SAM-dependent methyltransferase
VARSWVDYWDGDHPIYVNDRHRLLHAKGIARDFARHIPSPAATVIDYGCGEALYAEEVARRCGRLILSDAAPGVRAKLAERLAALPNVAVLAPDDIALLPDGTADLIVANSLLQYLDDQTLDGLLALWRYKLRESGALLLADVIPPDVSPVTDAAALLGFGFRGGFLGAAVAGLVRTALSDYRTLRGELGLAKHSEPAMLLRLERQGYLAARVHPNFGHNQARMTFRATRG